MNSAKTDTSPPQRRTLSYATPTARRPIRFAVYALTSCAITVVSTFLALLMTFREGLTEAEAERQMLVGKVIAAAGVLIAIFTAGLSYRQRDSTRVPGYLALILALVAGVFIFTQLPGW